MQITMLNLLPKHEVPSNDENGVLTTIEKILKKEL